MSIIRNMFISPEFFGFLALLIPIIILYFLKLRRTEVLISSTFLWRKSMHDVAANAPFQRLRMSWLLFLQLLFLILLCVALARPFMQAMGWQGNHVCLLIDRSASMATQEEEGTRLDTAKQRALEVVDSLKRGDKAMVVTFAQKAEVRCELTTDKRRLRDAIAAIETADTVTLARDAFDVVRSLAPDQQDAQSAASDIEPGGINTVLFSDGDIEDLDRIGAQVRNVRFAQVGTTTNNTGIVTFSTRPTEDRTEQQTLVRVKHVGETPLETTLSLYWEDAALAVEEVALTGDDATELVFTHPILTKGILRAELDTDDALAVDNVAWLAMRPSVALRALIVAEPDAIGAHFIKRALALDPRVEVATTTPASYADSDLYDLTIFDGFAPATLPPGTSLFFNAVPPLEGLALGDTIDRPPILAKEANHPVMYFLEPANIIIQKARRMTLPEGARILLSTDEGALLADVSRHGRRILVAPFDLADTNWPLRLSFPLFMQNVVSWIPKTSEMLASDISAGSPLPIPAMPGVVSATLVTPDGNRHEVPLSAERTTYVSQTEQSGVYTVDIDGVETQYAVNLLSERETDIAPATSLQLGRAEVAGERGRVKQTRELWRWLAGAALVILCVEWWVYCRRN